MKSVQVQTYEEKRGRTVGAIRYATQVIIGRI